MNLLIIYKTEMVSENEVVIAGKRVDHLREILDAKKGTVVRAGLFNGKKGTAEIVEIDEKKAVLKTSFPELPEPKIPLTVIIGLCRPKVISRLISDLTTYGVKRIDIIQTYYGDKGYWANDIFTPSGLEECIVKGLEQSMDTVPPRINLIKRFGPYSNDVLPQLISSDSKGFVCSPTALENLKIITKGTENVIAIGPERGFTKYELSQFINAGFEPAALGSRILRTESAVHVAVAQFIL